jgi:hypothetical protein
VNGPPLIEANHMPRRGHTAGNIAQREAIVLRSRRSGNHHAPALIATNPVRTGGHREIQLHPGVKVRVDGACGNQSIVISAIERKHAADQRGISGTVKAFEQEGV